MQKHKPAFTLVELIVVITILSILWTIAFITLNWYSTQARDSTRITDISSIKTTLELYNLESWKYPLPTDYTLITYSWWIIVWKQWTFWETAKINVDKLDKIPVDPLVEREYTYSLTDKWNEYQLWWIMEWTEITYNNSPLDKWWIVQSANAWDVIANAYVTWNYNWMLTKVINGEECDILSVPSIITSNVNVTELEEIVDMNLFVFRWYKNLPSSYRWSKFNEYGWFPFAPNKLLAYSDTWNCETLTDRTDHTSKLRLIKWLQESYLWTILQNEWDIKEITDININLNNPSVWVIWRAINAVNNKLWWNIVPEIVTGPELPWCITQPIVTNATFTVWVPTQLRQQWQTTDLNAACYWTCWTWKVLQWMDCLSTTAGWTPPTWTSEVSNSTSLIWWTWHYSTTPWIATYTCNTWYTRWTGVCNINVYTVSWSMWASAWWATLNIWWTSVTADWSWNFSSWINYGTSINNISITKTWYTCTVTTNWPSSLTGNISNIAWNCIINTYTVSWNLWSNANWVTVNVWWTSVVANSSWWFIATVNYGTNSSNITATRTWYACTITINWPSSLTGNISNIAWSCTTTSYIVSWSFWANASLATINVCWASTSADTNWNFTYTRNYWSNCSNITATRSWYTCTTSTNWPASLTANTTNIAWSCTVLSPGCESWMTDITLSNGQTWSCMNLWATTVRNWSTEPTNCSWSSTNCNSWLTWLWNYYQWWRNDTGWSIWQAIWSNDWQPQNENAWWNTTNTSIARQWPCPTGRHVPSMPEWQSACNNILSTTCMNGMLYDPLIATKLKLPFAGMRYWNNGYYYHQSMYANYWSSTPSGVGAGAYLMWFCTYNMYPINSNNRDPSYSVRCIKN